MCTVAIIKNIYINFTKEEKQVQENSKKYPQTRWKSSGERRKNKVLRIIIQ